jgi:hypothetical protein
VSGTVPVYVRCLCPDRWVPHHISREHLAFLVAHGAPPEMLVTVAKCRRCKARAVACLRDLAPSIRQAA